MKLNLNLAPSQGQMLAYTRKEVIYQPYSGLDEVKQRLESEELLELHLFDSNKEYRAVSTISHRFSNGFIEHVADFKTYEDNDIHCEDKDAYSTYCEKALLEERYSSKKNEHEEINVWNKVKYDDHHAGMAYVEDYRLVKGNSK